MSDDDTSAGGSERDSIPDECQLCRLLDYRGDEINEPEGMVEVSRDDGGTKIVHCCERCADELFTTPGFTRYVNTGSDRHE